MAIIPGTVSNFVSQKNPAQTTIDNFLSSVVNSNSEPVLFKIQGETIADIDVSSFVLHITEIENLSLESEFTDNLIEDGSYIQNHSISKPITMSVEGYVTNIFSSLSSTQKITQLVNQKLGIVSVYAPNISGPAIQAYNKINNKIQGAIDYVDSAIQNGKNLLDFLNSAGKSKTEVDKKIGILTAIYNARQPLTCYPCGIEVKDVYIQNLNFSRKPITQKGRVDISMTLKQVRFNNIVKKVSEAKISSPKRKGQGSSVKNQGVVSPKKEDYGTELFKGANSILKF